MSTKIIGNQIDQVTRAIMEALQVTEQINLPALNQSAVNALGTPAYGTLVYNTCLLYTSPSPRDVEESRMPSSA